MQISDNEKLVETNHSLFVWFLLAFLVGLGLRLWRLSDMRFTLAEAQIAQGAWQMARGDASGLPGNMSYAGLSAFLFFLFEPSYLFARLMPVLLGSSLILVPWFWRDVLGKQAALVLAFGFGNRSTLVKLFTPDCNADLRSGWSRLGDDGAKNKRPVLAGSMLSLAFLGGYTFWVVALVGGVVFLVRRKHGQFEFASNSYKAKTFLMPFLRSFFVSLVLVCSAFLLCSQGLGGIGAGLVEFVQLFGKKYEIALYQPIMVALAYSILPLFFAIWALIDDLRNHQPLKNLPFLIGWVVSVLLSVLLGRRDLGMLVFAAVFAWLAAAGRIAHILEQGSERQEIVLAVTLFQIVILGYIQMVSGRLVSSAVNSQEFQFALFAVLAGVLLLVISTILVGMGWSRQVGRQALQNSLLIMLIFLTVGLSLRSIRSQQESTTLSLLAGPIVLPNNDIEEAVAEIDREGRADRTEITYDLGSLEQELSWFFRQQVNWKSTKTDLQADLMLSENETDFSAADAYRGRNIVLFRNIDTNVVKPVDFLKTLLGEPLPSVSQNGILWVRLNLFTGAN